MRKKDLPVCFLTNETWAKSSAELALRVYASATLQRSGELPEI
jgi:hypothetical protein